MKAGQAEVNERVMVRPPSHTEEEKKGEMVERAPIRLQTMKPEEHDSAQD